MTTTDPHSHDSQLDALVAHYIEAIERGETPDREKLIAENPALADGLRRFFTDCDRLQLTNLQPAAHQANPDATFIPQHVPQPGTIFGGRYKLLQNIGEGGMGSVWVAEQREPVKRKVAIKLVKAGMDSKQVLARFEAERQALAMMDHPNIAKVFDGGINEHGRPYFVMEYVKGVPFTEYCNKARLSLKERLNLFIPVCQAVQHAHHKGIVHRDLKPSNILICLYDGKPVPKVIDFGLAKALHQQLTEQSIFTAHGVMVGTPLYMSPEQAEHNNLDVDTRTDIYSLGVVLYELLTGTTPLEREQLRTAAYNEVLRLIKEVEPPRPSTRLSGSDSLPSIAAQRSIDPRHLQKSVAGDLDWIVMKSLEKERSRRYETANGFVRDIERFLNDEAVEACPPSRSYRLKKFLRKHKAQVIAASLIFVTLITGLVGTGWGLKQARDAEARTAAALVQVTEESTATELEKQKSQAAAEAERAARQRAETAEAELVVNFRESTNDVIKNLIGSKSHFGPAEQAYLERTLERWTKFANRQQDDALGRTFRAEGHRNVGDTYMTLGSHAEAQREYVAANHLLKQLVAEHPESGTYLLDLADTQNNLGAALKMQGKLIEARDEVGQAINTSLKLIMAFQVGPRELDRLAIQYSNLARIFADLNELDGAQTYREAARDTLVQLIKMYPDAPDIRHNLAQSHNDLGVHLNSVGKIEEGQREQEEALKLWEALVQDFPMEEAYQADLARVLTNLGRPEIAKPLLEKLMADFPAVPEHANQLGHAKGRLGVKLWESGNSAAAKKEYESSQQILEALVTTHPDVPEYLQELSYTLSNFSLLLEDMSDTEAARSKREAAIEIGERLIQNDPTNLQYQSDANASRLNLARLLTTAGDLNAAQEQLEMALAGFIGIAAVAPSVQEFQLRIAVAHGQLAETLIQLGQTNKSKDHFLQSISILDALCVASPEVTKHKVALAGSRCNLAVVLATEGQFTEALSHFSRAIEELRLVSQTEPGNANCSVFLRKSLQGSAIARSQAGQFEAAVSDAAELISMSATGESVKFSPGDWYNFACIYSVASEKLPDKQVEYSNRSMELLKKAIDGGYNTPEAAAHMATDPDLNPLRERDEFKQLMESLSETPEPAADDPSPTAGTTPLQPCCCDSAGFTPATPPLPGSNTTDPTSIWFPCIP